MRVVIATPFSSLTALKPHTAEPTISVARFDASRSVSRRTSRFIAPPSASSVNTPPVEPTSVDSKIVMPAIEPTRPEVNAELPTFDNAPSSVAPYDDN